VKARPTLAAKTEFDLQLERFADATYSMRLIAEGFEAEGGRSVTGTVDALVSALPYVIGCKPDGDLRYIEMDKPRTVDLIAVDPQLNRIALANVTANVIAQEQVSVLTKQENGNFAYESVLKERVAKSEKISVSANGLHYALPPTSQAITYSSCATIRTGVSPSLQFCVIGRGAVSRSLEKNAELQVKLDRAQYNSGDEIAVSITAPYAGSGLITIERDHVYTQQWFHADSASSVQHIRVPEDFEGSGYVNVAFVRALDSKEIFVSPLSYGVVPFTANKEKRRLNVEINASANAKAGRIIAHQLQDRSAQQDRHLRGGRRNSSSHRLQNAGSARVLLPQMHAARRHGADCRSDHSGIFAAALSVGVRRRR
jgi:uncharacterized protein YfaS (alpha-2-macroglobulin family)